MKKGIRKSITIMLVIVMIGTACVFASDNKPIELEVTESNAPIIASMFVSASIKDSEWNQDVSISTVRPLYSKSDQAAAYYVGFSLESMPKGYVVVSKKLDAPLIIEYSDTAELMVNTDSQNTSKVIKIEEIDLQDKVYYSPFCCALYDLCVSEYLTPQINDNEREQYFASNVKILKAIAESGILSISYNSYYSNPLDWLAVIDPYASYSLVNSNSIGNNLVSGYIINGNNACVCYSTACILYRYLKSNYTYTYTQIQDKCKEIAINGGYCNSPTDYYVSNTNTVAYITACKNYYGLAKNVSWALLTLNNVKVETSNNRPFGVNIAQSPQYTNHTVTGFGWATYVDSGLTSQYDFIKIMDGYYAAARYVCLQYIVLVYMTRVQ